MNTNVTRPDKTAADYLVIGVSPALIMVMVHSLCFFLVDIFYRGEAIGGVRWVLFWFVLAVVLIARIGIEQDAGHAMTYGVLLAVVTWIYLATIQPNVIFGAILLGLVWFTAHQLTVNCTLIDEDDDASGEGLLESAKRAPGPVEKKPTTPARETTSTLSGLRPAAVLAVLKQKRQKAAREQIPGIWLIYYSLAALPIFGLGQTLLPSGDWAARHRGFVYLFCYLAAALGLLMATSFLGLRRYLRQRRLVMPGYIAFGWIQFGAVSAIIVLCLALLLPRPGSGAAWVALRYRIDSQIRQASQFAARFGPHGHGAGRAGNQTSPDGKEQNPSTPPDQTSGDSQGNGGSGKSPGQGPGDQQSNEEGKQGPPGHDGSGNPGQHVPNLSPPAAAVYPWMRLLFWIVVGLGAGWLLFRYRLVILAAFQSIWAALRSLIAMLLGLQKPQARAVPIGTKLAQIQPFNRFKNPFLTGADRIWPAEQLIIYSYDALQSWVLEQGVPRAPQTPREFCRQMAVELPDAATELEQLAFLYGHVAYGRSVPANYDPETLRALWGWLGNARPMQSRNAG